MALGPGFSGDGRVRRVTPAALLWYQGGRTLVRTARGVEEREELPWVALPRLLEKLGLPAWGYLAYELAAQLADPLAAPPGDAPLPAAFWVVADPQSGLPAPLGEKPTCGALTCSLAAQAFCAGVRRIREAIAAGEVYQVNLTRRWQAPFSGDPATLFLHLAEGQLPRFAFFLEDPVAGLAMIGMSPELFLEKRGPWVESWPIKGTWASQKAAALPGEKEQAELAMIVDLVRHDLGRVCLPGSVTVVEPSRLVRTREVVHREAVVRGKVPPGVGLGELLEAAFPGGSVTGAPKIAACRLIAALEPVPRSVYCGAYGVLYPNGDAVLAMPIRTGYVVGGTLFFHAGSGIVWDSGEEAEEMETRAKVASWLAACGGVR